jgi:hypothetical protein
MVTPAAHREAAAYLQAVHGYANLLWEGRLRSPLANE